MLESLPGGIDGEVHVGFVRLCDVGQHVACPRVPRLKRLACKMKSITKTNHMSAIASPNEIHENKRLANVDW